MLETIDRGLRQIVEGRGVVAELPLAGLGQAAFLGLLVALGLRSQSVGLLVTDSGWTINIATAELDGAEPLLLFNRISPGELGRGEN